MADPIPRMIRVFRQNVSYHSAALSTDIGVYITNGLRSLNPKSDFDPQGRYVYTDIGFSIDFRKSELGFLSIPASDQIDG